MSGKSSVANQVIALPKGGGALHGLGEKFTPDLFTGTGNFSIPMALPQGRNNHQPALDLVYSTGNGNSPFGLGWNLNLPDISRKTAKGIPHYNDQTANLTERDIFILSGAEDLIPVDDSPDLTRYRPRTEGLFAGIEHHHTSQDNFWEVSSKDGLVSRYAAQLSDPVHPSRIFAWKITRTVDPFGNVIEYLYESDTCEDGPHHWNQLYLSQIRYGDYLEQGQVRFLVTVTLDYSVNDQLDAACASPYLERPDAFSEYRSGFEIRTRWRCESITVETHAEANHRVRRYGLSYDNTAPNGVSLLRQIQVFASDDQIHLPPLDFEYTVFDPDRRDLLPVTGDEIPAGSLTSSETELIDLFGTGLPDFLEMNGTVRYWRNLGHGKFGYSRPMHEAPAGLKLADPGVQLMDVNGDGRLDLLVSTDGIVGYFPLGANGCWNHQSFKPYTTAPTFSLEDPEVKLVDLNGDGVTDAIRSGTRLECFFQDQRRGWDEKQTRFLERRALSEFPNVNFSDSRVRWADMTGDGLQDIVLVYDGNVDYWPNLGYGNWGRCIHMRNNPSLPYSYDPRRILLGDVDGDGAADIVYVDNDQVMLWINQSGNRWSDPIVIEGTPPVTDMDALRLVDLLGSGISGVLWSMDGGSGVRPHAFFLDFTGGTKPYLLNVMTNHLGAETQVSYASSTHYYLEDEKQHETRWRTTIPFPVQVVGRVDVIDELSHSRLTTEYRYHHGCWDGGEREFRGFGLVEQLDTGISTNAPEAQISPPTLTKNWFHLGPMGDEFGAWEVPDFSHQYWAEDSSAFVALKEEAEEFIENLPRRRTRRDAVRALRGSLLRMEMYALDDSSYQDRPYTVSESVYGICGVVETNGTAELIFAVPNDASAADIHIFFPHLVAQRTSQWERGSDPMTQVMFTGDYDAYGQPRTQINIGVPRSRNYRMSIPPQQPAPPEDYLVTYTQTVYAQPTGQSTIVDRVARVTTYEIISGGRDDVLTLKQKIESHTLLASAFHVIGQILNYYDGDAFEGLAQGLVGNYGALACSESLVLTEDILTAAYGSSPPPYLDAVLLWTADYVQGFRDGLPPQAGYRWHPSSANSVQGYFAFTERCRYDFHTDPNTARGLMDARMDALDHITTIVYDDFDFLPVSVTDPATMTTRVRYDYRVLQPAEVTDANGNRTLYTYDALGMLASSVLSGSQGEGDIGQQPDFEYPSTILEYDFLAYQTHQQPVYVHTIKRVDHAADLISAENVQRAGRGDPLLSTAEIEGLFAEEMEAFPERFIQTREYSDGLGRLLQTRTQAEDVIFGDSIFGDGLLHPDQTLISNSVQGQTLADRQNPNVVVSGWQIYDNKGRVIEKYEPFYSTGWDYRDPAEEREQVFGQKTTLFYDPRGREIRSINPDGSEKRVIYGIPQMLTNPTNFQPTPWEIYTYDANDNAGRTHAAQSASYGTHYDTPSSVTLNALGHQVEQVDRNGSNTAGDWYRTRFKYDIRGNLLMLTDARNRTAFRYFYDLANRPLLTENLDMGTRWAVIDAAGNLVERRDSKGACGLYTYDDLNRFTHFWARDEALGSLTLRERRIYGDSPESQLSRQQAADLNLCTKLYRHYDEAGLLTYGAYDFKGNILEKTRQIIADAAIQAVFGVQPWRAFRVDWDNPPALGQSYVTSMTYDALNRLKTLHYPSAGGAARQVLTPEYNRAGALMRMTLSGAPYVEHIAYNAKGQRTLIVYGNNVMTRYAYDPQTFRLRRLRTERCTIPAPYRYERQLGQNDLLQDLAYEYDLAGNVTAIHDRTPDSGLPTQLDRLDRVFTYDPLYRLRSATGRECDTLPYDPFNDSFRCADLTRTHAYRQTYTYDSVGNVEEINQFVGTSNAPRRFILAANSNQLAQVDAGGQIYPYAYDANGNLISEGLARHFEWDHSDRLRVYRTQTGTAEPSIHTHYLYDASGERVMKWTRHQGGNYEATVYIDGVFEHYRWDQTTSSPKENYRLHIMDNQSRIAIWRIGTADDAGPAVQYHLGDHLGGSSLVLGGTNAVLINREEYYPYGETSFGSFSRKRYRFTGKERDEESKLYYHGARYYAPWLARWVSCDPIGAKGGPNVYAYVQGNPLNLVDKSGLYEVAPNTPANRKVESKIGSTIVDLFEDSTTREGIRGKGFSLRAWLFDKADYAKGTGTGVNVRLRPFGAETKELNYLVPGKNPKVEYFGYTYCVAVTFQYAMLAIEKINRAEHHYGFGKIKADNYVKLLQMQELWYRSGKSLGAPEALVKMGLGYYVKNIETDLHPGAQINYYGSNVAGSEGGHSLTFLRYDESFSFGKYFSNLFGSKSIKEFFQNLFNFSGAYERSGIVAISQGEENTYSFNFLKRKAATAANWLPTKAQVKKDK